MTGNHSKGKAKEREFLEWIGKPGFVFPMNKFGHNDAFGVFDGFYLTSAGTVVFFQVCHRSTRKRHREAIERFVEQNPTRAYLIALYAWDMRYTSLGAPFYQAGIW